MVPFHEAPVAVSLTAIDWDERTFEIRSFAQTAALRDSFGRCGVLRAPWVLRGHNGSLAIVDGFKRLEWLRESGTESAACIVFPRETDLRALWLCRLTEKVFGPCPNPAEKAQIVARLVEVVPEDADRRLLLGRLALPAHPNTLDRWRRLASAGPVLLTAAANGSLCERAALELASWDEEDGAARERFLGLLEPLRCSASIQMEILERITDIARAGDTSRLDVLERADLQSVLGHTTWNHREKTQALRDLLGRLRYPRLHQRELAFQRQLAALSLPPSLRLAPPPFFEGDRYRLQMDFSSPEELSGLLDSARALAEDPRLRDLMRPPVSRES